MSWNFCLSVDTLHKNDQSFNLDMQMLYTNNKILLRLTDIKSNWKIFVKYDGDRMSIAGYLPKNRDFNT